MTPAKQTLREACFLWFHDWAKWSELIQQDGKRTSVYFTEGIMFTRTIQTRHCKRCNQIKERIVVNG